MSLTATTWMCNSTCKMFASDLSRRYTFMLKVFYLVSIDFHWRKKSIKSFDRENEIFSFFAILNVERRYLSLIKDQFVVKTMQGICIISLVPYVFHKKYFSNNEFFYIWNILHVFIPWRCITSGAYSFWYLNLELFVWI